MGRAGAGGGGGSRSGGGHSSSRSSGGHRMSGGSSHSSHSSYGGGRSSYGGGHSSYGGGHSSFGGSHGAPHGGGGFGGPGGPGGPRPPRPHRTVVYTNGGGGGARGAGCGIFLWVLLAFLIIAVIGTAASSCSSGASNGGSGAVSTTVREKLDTGNSYLSDCIVDELGWFDSTSSTASKLKSKFYSETGVQPYIVMKAYDASLTSEAAKEAWTETYYDEHFDREDVFLYVYFAEQDENEVGYMTYTCGVQAQTVMDAEAMEIFWDYLDAKWYSDLSTDDLFVQVYGSTAETIMAVPTNGADVAKVAVIFVGVIGIGVVVFLIIREKHRRAKEKAEEDQKILNTPINDLAKDDLTEKYASMSSTDSTTSSTVESGSNGQ